MEALVSRVAAVIQSSDQTNEYRADTERDFVMRLISAETRNDPIEIILADRLIFGRKRVFRSIYPSFGPRN